MTVKQFINEVNPKKRKKEIKETKRDISSDAESYYSETEHKSVKKPSKEIMKEKHKHKHSWLSHETSSNDLSVYEDEIDSDSETSPPKKAKKRFTHTKLTIDDMKRRKGIPVRKQLKTGAKVAVDMSEWTSIMEFVK